MKDDAWYFAYGSNLSVEQKERRTGPIRKAICCRLKDYRLAFNKRGTNGDVYANVIPEPTEEVWGVIYRCSTNAFREMDRHEGVSTGHYERMTVTVESEDGEMVTAITYIAGAAHVCEEALPNDDYLQMILQGARYHRLPQRYIRSIEIRSGRRSCHDNERLWRGFCVDKELQNSWLDQLNLLKAFELISICEGHPTESRRSLRSAPHINLRMKAGFVAGIASKWNDFASDIRALLENVFSHDDTSVTVELRRRIYFRSNGIGTDDDVVVLVNSRVTSSAGTQVPIVTDWFDRCVASIRKLDIAFVSVIAPQNTAQQAVQPDTDKGGASGLV